MKTLKLKSFILEMGGTTKTIDTCDVLLQTLESTGKGGLQMSVIRERLPVMDKISEAQKSDAESIEFEDEELKILSDVAEAMQWTIFSRDIVDLTNDLKELAG